MYNLLKEELDIENHNEKLRDSAYGLGFDEKLVLFNIVFAFVPIFVCGLTTFVLTIYILTKDENRRRIASIPYAFYLIIWAVFSFTAGFLHKNFLGNAAFLLYLSYIIFSFYTFMVMTQQLARRIIQLSAALGIVAFVIAVFEKFINPAARTASTFNNANYYGFICEMVILVNVYGLLRLKSCRWLFIASIAANFGGLFLSGCRSGWIATYGGIVVLLFLFKKYSQAVGILCAGGIYGLIAMIFPQIIPRSGTIDATMSLRYRIWEVAFQGFLKYPIIGQGFLGYMLYSHGMGHVYQQHAHDILLNALDNYGILGTLLIMIFIVPAVFKCFKKLKSSPICALVLSFVAAIIIHGIADDPMLGIQTGIFSMMLLALGGASSNDELSSTAFSRKFTSQL